MLVLKLIALSSRNYLKKLMRCTFLSPGVGFNIVDILRLVSEEMVVKYE